MVPMDEPHALTNRFEQLAQRSWCLHIAQQHDGISLGVFNCLQDVFKASMRVAAKENHDGCRLSPLSRAPGLRDRLSIGDQLWGVAPVEEKFFSHNWSPIYPARRSIHGVVPSPTESGENVGKHIRSATHPERLSYASTRLATHTLTGSFAPTLRSPLNAGHRTPEALITNPVPSKESIARNAAVGTSPIVVQQDWCIAHRSFHRDRNLHAFMSWPPNSASALASESTGATCSPVRAPRSPRRSLAPGCLRRSLMPPCRHR